MRHRRSGTENVGEVGTVFLSFAVSDRCRVGAARQQPVLGSDGDQEPLQTRVRARGAGVVGVCFTVDGRLSALRLSAQ